MIIVACNSIEDNSYIVEFLIDVGADIKLQDNVSINEHNFIIFIVIFKLCNGIFYSILHMQIYISET